MVVEEKMERILQAGALQGLPVATDGNVFPLIPDTDSFLVVPKNNDSGKKDDCVVPNNDHPEDEGGQTSISKGGHVRRNSTGNITIPYAKVKILSRYLASSSTGSCHDYCKYGARKEGDHEEMHNNNTSTHVKRFNETLGRGHHGDRFRQAAATLMERRKRMPISHLTPPKTTTMALNSPKPDSQLSGSSRKGTTSSVASEVGAVVGVSPKPQRPTIHSFSKNIGTANSSSNNTNPSTRLGSSSADGSPQAYPLAAKSTTTPLSKPSSSPTSEMNVAEQPRSRSVSVSKVETRSSSAHKLPILSRIFSSSSADVGVRHYPKPHRVEASFVSPFHRRGGSMSKLSLSSLSLDPVEDPKVSPATPQQRIEVRRCKSSLPKSLGAKEDRREQKHYNKNLEASAASLNRSGSTSGNGKTRAGSTTISSPAKHNFLRRQSFSEPLKSPAARLNRQKSENGKAISHPHSHSHSKKDQPSNSSNVKKPNEADQPKNEQLQDQISTSIVKIENSINIDVEAETATDERGPITASPPNKPEEAKDNINIPQPSIKSTRKRVKKHHHSTANSSPLFHDKYKINLRRTRARSVVSEPNMDGSKDSHSVVSSTETCATDFVLEEKAAMERVVASRKTYYRRTRRAGTVLSIGEEQARKLTFRPGRVIELKPEITSYPRRLKFKRRAPRNDHSSQSKVDVTSFGVLRKGGGRRSQGIHRRVEFVEAAVGDAEKVVLRHQETQGEKVLQASQNNVIEETASKLVEDRKSKVKALVGAFESLLTLQDSKPLPSIAA